MIPAIRAEFRKLFTVRSTYVISLLFLALGAFFAFYGYGMQSSQHLNDSSNPVSGLFVQGSLTMIGNILSVAAALIGLLLLAHEYRYNTIIYTLTSNNSRNKVLTAKILAILAYVFVYSIVSTAILLAMVFAGVAAAGHVMPVQDINYLTFFAKSVFFCEAFALAGLLFIALIRNQIGAIAALLILPNTIEGLLSLLLKSNVAYLPFTALQQVVQPATLAGAVAANPNHPDVISISPARGAVIFLCWLVVGWIIAWILFLRRDAN
jgi:ABC-type transport system involved in multi-copper enzyme maturation permease subunit